MSKLILKAIPANATTAAADKTVGNIDTAGSTQRLTVQAQPKTQYRLVDAKTGEVVKNQTVLRHGKQLQVMVDGVNAVELDNFFPEEAVNAAAPADSASYLVDTGAAGAPSYGVVSAQTPMEVSANGVSTLWTPGMPALPLVEPVAFGAPALAAVSASSAGGLAAGLGLAAAAAGGGGGGGGGSSSSTSSAKVTGVGVKAEVATNYEQLRVAAFNTKGESMGDPVGVDKNGKYVFVLKDTTFTGTLVLKMYDVNPDDDIKPTFYDEATGDTKDFTKPLYAVVNYGEAGKEVKVNITPLTNLAATVAGVDTKLDKPTLSGTAAETEKLVKEANTKVAQKFGLNEADLTAADVKTTNSDQANDYGVALAIMSQMEKKQADTDSSKNAQDAVADLFKNNSSDFTNSLKTAVTELKKNAGTNNDYLKNIDTSKLDKVSEVASDTTAPVLVTTGTKANTNIDGTKVYLHFDSELSKNTADKSQFKLEVTTPASGEVQAVTTTPAISSVAIDGNDVVLTLATKIAKGQTVTVSYNDPTANTNDLLAVQDVAGNDADSISATTVVNNVTEVKPVITVDASQIFAYEENQTTKGGFEAQVQASATEGVTVTKFRFADSQASISKDGWYSIDKDGNISLTNVGLSAGKASNDFETKINGGNALVYGVQAGDNAGNWSDSVNITLNVTDDKTEAPSVNAPVSFTVTEDVAGNLVFAKDAFADPDSTNLTVTLNVKDDFGTLSYDAVKATAANITVTPSGKTFAFNGKTSDLNAYFSTAGNLSYQDVKDYSGTRTLNIKVSDGDLSKSITSNIKVTAVNDAPAGTDKTLTILEEGSKTFAAADFGLTDASDTPANTLSAVIITSLPAADAGSLKLNNVAVTPNQSIAVADLGKLVYTPAVNGSGDAYASIGFKVQDNGGTANDGKNTSTNANTLTINVTPVNDKPTLTATAASPTFTEGSDPVGVNSQSVQGKAVSVFSGASISTVEAGQTITSLTFTVSGLVDGKFEKISIDGVTIPLVTDVGSIKAGLNYDVSITNGGVATVVLTMDTGLSASDAQALIDSIKYQNTLVDNPTEGNRVFTLTQIQDNGGTSNSGVDTSTLNVGSTVKVVAVNDAPVNSMDPIDVEANIKTFILNGDGEETQTPNTSQFAFNDLSISDVDASDGNMSVTLSVTNGSLAHTDFDGVRFTDISKRSFKASGSLTILNEWLASEDLKYTPDEDFVGTDKLTMLTNDGGNTGSGGEKTASSTADLNVNDTAGPTLLKVETDENNGAIIYLTYSEALDATNIPSKDDFALTVRAADESAVTDYSVASVSVSGRVVTLTLNKALQVEQSVSLAYTLNGDTALVQDVKGNDADSIEDASVNIKVPDLVNPVVTLNQILSYDENQSSGDVVATVKATDNVRVTGYRFVTGDNSFSDTTADGKFKIDNRGQISITDAGARSAYNNYESEDRSVVYAVQALDAKGNVSEAVDVRLNVDDVNEIPIAQSYALLPDMVEDTPIEFTGADLRAAAIDPEGNPGGTTLKYLISGVTSGTLKKWDGSDWLAVQAGVTVVESTERLQWTPPADVNRINNGQIEAFKVKAIDDPFTTNEIPIKVVISPANDAPTVVSGKASVTLPAIDEDASSITGATVSSLFSASFSDAKDNVSGGSSANTLSGIAITKNYASAAQGKWQWSANGSTNWTDIPNNTAGSDAPTDTHVYYLRADASLRFAPATDFNGTAGALITHLVESSWPNISGATNGLRVNNPDSKYYTADAVTLSTSVNSVNDAPTGTDKPITIDEDGSKTFSAADFGFEDAKDTPANTLSAVIITSLPAVGSLKLNTVDVTLNQSIAAADLDKLVYAPAANGNGNNYASIGFKVKDNGGGTTDTSASANTLTINVTPVNDKPTVVDGKSTVILPSIEEDPVTNNGATVGDLFGASFSDAKDGALANPFVGIGITDMASTAAQGNWQYQSGGTWNSIDYSGAEAPSATNVLYFTASTPLRFKPAANFNGTPGGLTAYLIEENTSGLSRFPNVNGDFFSADPVTLTTSVTAVNDAPKNTVPLSAVSVTANIDTYDLAGVKQTYTPKAITGLSVSDMDAGTSSMSVTLSVTNGSLAHNTRSGSGVTFTDTSASSFTASGNQTDLNDWLASTGGVSYTPTANSVSGDTLTMLTNDGGNSGSGGEKTDTDSVTLNVSDTRAPVLLKAETSVDGQSIVLTYDEALDSSHIAASSQYSLAVTDAGTSVAVNITGVSVDNLGRTVTLSLSQAVQIQQVVKLNYSDPIGDTTNTVQDVLGNDALSLTNKPITIKVPDIVKPTVTTSAALTYNENQTAGAVVGTVTADDNVGVTGYRFASADGTSGSATSADGFFTIASDGKVSITATGAAAGAASNDFETIPNSFTYAIQATDGTNWSDSVNVTLNLKNVDEAGSIGAITNTSSDTRSTTTLQQGDTLTAGTITDPDGGVTGITYQWKAGGSNVGTNAATYTLSQADVGKAISVVASYSDAQGGNKTATSNDTGNVVNVNDAPTLTTITKLTGFTEDTYKEISYQDLVNAADESDVDAGDAIKFRIETVSTGTLQKLSGSTWADVVAGTTTVATGEKLQWKAAQDANGNGLNAFTVKAVDTVGAASSAVQVKADVSAVNDQPTVVAGQSTVTLPPIQEDPGTNTGATIDSLFRGSFSDAKDNVTGGSSANAFFAIGVTNVASTDEQGNWEYKDNSGNWVPIANSGGPSLSNVYYFVTSTPLRFKPAANFSGTPGGLTAYLIEQNTSGRTGFDNVNYDFFSATSVTLNTSVTAVNDAPTGANNTITILEDGSKTFAAADFGFADASDSPANTLSAVIITTLPTAGTLKLSGTAVTVNQSIPVANLGNLVYAPVANANGSNYASIGFKVQDNGGGTTDTSVTANTLTINVTASNDAPSITTPSAPPGAYAGVAYSLPTGFRVADVDAGTNAVQISFKVAEGSNTVGDALAYTLGTGVTVVAGSPDANKVYTFQGTLTDLNNWMATAGYLKFTPTAGFTGNASITTSVNDLGNSGGAALSANGTSLSVAVTSDSTPPVITAPASPFTYKENWYWNENSNTFPTMQVSATDLIGVTQYRFSSADGSSNTGSTTSDGYFTIDTSGKISIRDRFTVTTNSPVNDFESGPNTWSYYVQAGDASNNWSTPVKFTLNEIDVAGEPVISGAKNSDGTDASEFDIHYLENRTNNAADIVGQILAPAGSKFNFETGISPASSAVNVSADGMFNIDINTGKITLTASGLSSANNFATAATKTFTERIAVYDSSYQQVTYQNITISLDDMSDETAPVFISAMSYVDGDGKTVHLYFNEPVVSTLSNAVGGSYVLSQFKVYEDTNSKGVTNIASNPSDPYDLILTLSTAVTNSSSVIKVQYTDPTAANDYYAAQDVNGNDLATFAQRIITNKTDRTAPVFQSADTSADGKQVILHYDEALSSSLPALTSFKVSVAGGSDINPSAVSVSGNDVVLNLATTITTGQSVTVKYSDPAPTANDTNAVQDVWGNDAVSLTSPQAVNNKVPDITLPTILTAVLGADGKTLTITFSEVIQNMGWMQDNRLENYFGIFFNVTVDSVSRGSYNLVSDGSDSNQIVAPLAGLPVARDSVVKLIYTDPHPTSFDAYSVHDLWNNELASVTKIVTNNSVL